MTVSGVLSDNGCGYVYTVVHCFPRLNRLWCHGTATQWRGGLFAYKFIYFFETVRYQLGNDGGVTVLPGL